MWSICMEATSISRDSWEDLTQVVAKVVIKKGSRRKLQQKFGNDTNEVDSDWLGKEGFTEAGAPSPAASAPESPRKRYTRPRGRPAEID